MKERQRPLPGFEVDTPRLHIPPAAKSASDEQSPCAFCGGPGAFLCDFVLGRSSADRNAQVHTCDAPMCRACKKQISSMILCSRGRSGHGCQHDTIDYCPRHAGQTVQGFGRIVTAEEAEQVRVTLWKKN